MTDFVPESPQHNFDINSGDSAFNMSLHIQELCRNKSSSRTTGGKNSSQVEFSQPIGASTPFGGAFQPPDLSSLNENKDAKCSFSCFSLSGEEGIHAPSFDFPSNAPVPSQIRPTSPTRATKIMGPPKEIVASREPLTNTQSEDSMPLSIPNHFDDFGNLLSLPGVLGSYSTKDVAKPLSVNKTSHTPRLSKTVGCNDSTVAFDTMSTFETPVLPNEQRGTQESIQLLVEEDCNQAGSPIIGEHSTVNNPSKEPIRLEYKASQPPSFVVPESQPNTPPRDLEVVSRHDNQLSDIEKLKQHITKNTRGSPIQFVTIPQKPTQPIRGRSVSINASEDTQETVVISKDRKAEKEAIIDIAKEYEFKSNEMALKKNLDEAKKTRIRLTQTPRRKKMIIEEEDDNDSGMEEEVAVEEEKTVEKSYFTLKADELRKRREKGTTDDDWDDSKVHHKTIAVNSDNLDSSLIITQADEAEDVQCSRSQPMKPTPSLAPGDRVWASKKDGYFYAATIMTIFYQGVFGIEFDDQSTDHLSADAMHKFTLGPGDPVEVLFGAEYIKGILHTQKSPSVGYFVIIEMRQRKKLVGPMKLISFRLSEEEVEFLYEKENILTLSIPSSLPLSTTPVKKESIVAVEVIKTRKRPLVDVESDQEHRMKLTKKENSEVETEEKSRVLKKKKIEPQKTTMTTKKIRPFESPLQMTGSGKKDRLFHRFQFLLTCVGNETKNGKNRELDAVKAMIADHGGEIVEIDEIEKNKRIKETILISAKACRTTKYLMALAKGLKRVHYSWIVDSVTEGKLFDFDEYYLPNGITLDDKEVDYLSKPCIFKQKIIYINAQKASSEEKANWQKMIQAADGQISHKQTDSRIDYFVSMSDEMPKKAPKKIKYLSKEWLCQCLIQQKLLPTLGFHLSRN